MRHLSIAAGLALLVALSSGCAADAEAPETDDAIGALLSPGETVDARLRIENDERLGQITKVLPFKPSALREFKLWDSETKGSRRETLTMLQKRYPNATFRFFEWEPDPAPEFARKLRLDILQMDRPNRAPVLSFFYGTPSTFIGACTEDAAGKTLCVANAKSSY